MHVFMAGPEVHLPTESIHEISQNKMRSSQGLANAIYCSQQMNLLS